MAISDDPAANAEVVAAGEPSTEDDTTVVVASAAASNLHASGLTEAEVEGLLYMREEENWPMTSTSPSTEFGAPRLPEHRQQRTDPHRSSQEPAGYLRPGRPSRQHLPLVSSSTLICKPSMTSWWPSAANPRRCLKVGAAIEEIDILDLQANLETLTAADVRQVYENLLFGSENHLRAFTSVLAQRTGEIYEPQYMDQAAYDAIVAESIQSGAGLSQGGRGGGRRP